MQFLTALSARLDVDTGAKTAAVVFTIPAAEGAGDVEVFRQDITSQLTTADKHRLRHLLDRQPPPDPPAEQPADQTAEQPADQT